MSFASFITKNFKFNTHNTVIKDDYHLDKNNKHDDDGRVGNPHLRDVSTTSTIVTRATVSTSLLFLMNTRPGNVTRNVKIMVGVQSSMIGSQINLDIIVRSK